jgi:hypothetical protein
MVENAEVMKAARFAGGTSGTSVIDVHARSAKKLAAAAEEPANASIEESPSASAAMGGAGEVGKGAATAAAAVSVFLTFCQGACPSIPPPFL